MKLFQVWPRLAVGACLTAALLSGCGEQQANFSSASAPEETVTETPPIEETASPLPDPEPSGSPEKPSPSQGSNTPSDVKVDHNGSDEQTSAGETLLDEDGTYSSMEDVALYLHTYGELPDNFITKNEARDLGWSGGGLEDYAPGKCIGGDRFGNREGLLPDGTYYECDIDTLGATSRGAERLVWDDNGNIYYTDDHYESFDLVYAAE